MLGPPLDLEEANLTSVPQLSPLESGDNKSLYRMAWLQGLKEFMQELTFVTYFKLGMADSKYPKIFVK